MVYFAKIGTDIKIGHTECLTRRFSEHRWYYKPGTKIEFLFAFDGGRKEEQQLHKQLNERRICSYPAELFRLSDEELDKIKDQARKEPGFVDAI